MTERSELQAGDISVPVIPYDTFEAANLFLATGRTRQEVLPLIGLNDAEWNRLREIYRWFPSSSSDFHRRAYFTDMDDADICRLVLAPRWHLKPGDEPNLRSTWHIREAVRRNPHIGPFKHCDWPYTFIAVHVEASLCCYTHDGDTVYFNGKPLTDRHGERFHVDARSFRAVGGRWLRDDTNAYGQGEYGGSAEPYWYVVDGADLETFEALNHRYARDGNRAYYITGKAIRTRSPDGFEIVPYVRLNYRDNSCDLLHDVSHIARDREAVYFYGARLKGARPEGFRDLGHGYAVNFEKVWFLDSKKLMEGADARTFTVPGPGEPTIHGRPRGRCVTDRYRPYIDGEPCEPTTYVDDWRPFFEARPDLQDWWWHRLARDR